MDFKFGSSGLTLDFLTGLSRTGNDLSKVLERLATGVNSDASLVELTGKYNTSSKLSAVAAVNVSNVASGLNTLKSALQENQIVLQNMRSLAAAADTASGERLTELQAEYVQYRDKFNANYTDTELPAGPTADTSTPLNGGAEITVQAGETVESAFTVEVGEIINNVSGTVYITESLGGGPPVTSLDGTYSSTSYETGEMPTEALDPDSSTYYDFDGDGDLDLVSGFASDPTPNATQADQSGLYISLNNGDGTFAAATNINITSGYQAGAGPSFLVNQVVAADFNNDGNGDLLVTYQDPTAIPQYMYGDGTGAFTSTATATEVAMAQGNVVLADLDGDNDLEIISFDKNGTDRYYVATNNGDGTYAAAAAVVVTGFTLGTTAQAIAFDDIDGDGNADAVFVGSASPSNYNIGYQLGNGDGTFGAATEITAFGNTAQNYDSVILSNVVGTGAVDIAAIGQEGAADKLFVAQGDGAAGFTLSHETTLADTLAQTGNDEHGINVVDYNGNGSLDFIIKSDNQTQIYLNNGGSAATASTIVGTSAQGFSPLVADFDGDNFDDFIVTGTGPANATDPHDYTVYLANTTSTGGGAATETVTNYAVSRFTFLTTDNLDNNTEAKRQEQIQVIDFMLQANVIEQANVESQMNRLNSAFHSASQRSDSFGSAKDRLENIDAALELSRYLRLSITAEAQKAISAQVVGLNLSAVSLLKGSLL